MAGLSQQIPKDMEAAWFRDSQWELTRREWGNTERQKDQRTFCSICGSSVCPTPVLEGGETQLTKAQKGKNMQGYI